VACTIGKVTIQDCASNLLTLSEFHLRYSTFNSIVNILQYQEYVSIKMISLPP